MFLKAKDRVIEEYLLRHIALIFETETFIKISENLANLSDSEIKDLAIRVASYGRGELLRIIHE